MHIRPHLGPRMHNNRATGECMSRTVATTFRSDQTNLRSKYKESENPRPSWTGFSSVIRRSSRVRIARFSDGVISTIRPRAQIYTVDTAIHFSRAAMQQAKIAISSKPTGPLSFTSTPRLKPIRRRPIAGYAIQTWGHLQ
jgi:hypothetical protein